MVYALRRVTSEPVIAAQRIGHSLGRGGRVACNHAGCMATEITGAQNQLWSDALPAASVTGDQTRGTYIQ